MAGYLWWPLRNNCCLLYVRPASPEKTLSHFTSSNESDSYNVTKTSKTLDKIFFFFKLQLPVVHFLFYCLCWNTVGHSVFTVCELVQFLQQSFCMASSLGPRSLVCWSASNSLMSPKSSCFAGFRLGNTPLNHSVGQVGSIPSIHWLWALWEWVARPCMSSKWSRGAFSWAFSRLHLILWTVLKKQNKTKQTQK